MAWMPPGAALYEAARDQSVPRLIHVMDREGDAYEVMMAVDDTGDSAVIRSAEPQDRWPAGAMHEAVRSCPELCRTTVPVSRKAGVPKRLAWLEVRSMAVTLQPDLEKYPHGWSMAWNLVEAWESTPPPGAEPVHWLLWTLEPSASATEAMEVIRKYTCRWPIEENSLGAQKRLPGRSAEAGEMGPIGEGRDREFGGGRRIVSLRDQARETPESLASEVLSLDEIEALVHHFGNGQKPSELTVGQAVMWIARLGGHLNRKRDGMPGVRTLWRGLHDLSLLTAGFLAGKNVGK